MRFLESPRLRLFIGAALISLSPVWVRLSDVAPSVSGFYRVVFGSLALVIYLLVTRRGLHLSRRTWWLLIVASVFFALDLWFWHRSILFIGPGLATLLANFQVFIMMIAGIVLLRQVPSVMQMIAVPLALFGLAMIVGFDWSGLPQNYQLGVIFGLLTAVAYAGYMLSLREARVGSTFRVPTREVAVVSVLTVFAMGASVGIEGESFANGACVVAATNAQFCLGCHDFRPANAGDRVCRRGNRAVSDLSRLSPELKADLVRPAIPGSRIRTAGAEPRRRDATGSPRYNGSEARSLAGSEYRSPERVCR